MLDTICQFENSDNLIDYSALPKLFMIYITNLREIETQITKNSDFLRIL